jgi:epoxyqueuosine reductase
VVSLNNIIKKECSMSLTDEVKKYARDVLEMDYVGVTGVDRLSGAPAGHRPTDILPGARSVVVMAVKLSLGVVQTIFRAHEDGMRDTLCIYGTHGYMFTPNYTLFFAAYRMARFLESRGYMSTPLPSGPGGGGAPFSHRHAMVAAGIGEFGWLSIVLTPDYGPRIRGVSVITRAELEPDPLYSGPKLCDRSKCDVCIRHCPTKAIDPVKSKKVTMGGRDFEYGFVHFDRCRVSAEGLTKKTLGRIDQDLPLDPTPEDIDKARAVAEPWKRMESIAGIGGAYYCGKCLAYCPAGQKDWLKTVSSQYK